MPASALDLARGLRRAFDERAERDRSVRPGRVVGRATDGRTLVLDLTGECIQATGSSGYTGEIVTQLPALLNRQGTAGVAVLARRDSAPLLWVTALDPDYFTPGATGLVVTVSGHGFSSATRFHFLLPGSEEIHPDITLVGSTYVDSETFELLLNIAAGAAPIPANGAALAFDDPGRR